MGRQGRPALAAEEDGRGGAAEERPILDPAIALLLRLTSAEFPAGELVLDALQEVLPDSSMEDGLSIIHNFTSAWKCAGSDGGGYQDITRYECDPDRACGPLRPFIRSIDLPNRRRAICLDLVRPASKLYEGTNLAKDIASGVVDQIEPVVQDAERLVELHIDLLRSELRQSAAETVPAIASLGAGAGLVAAGGLLGALAFVHGLHRATRMPLWTCYGLVGGVLGTAGAGLVGAGGRRLSGVSLVPYETLATFREDLEWVKGKMK